MLHIVRNEDPPGDISEPAITFPYEPDAFQKHAFRHLEDNHHLLVTAHTGSGKTSIGEYAIGKAIRDGKKVVYTAPIKALSNQIYGDLKRKYPSWDLGIKTGDIDLNSNGQAVIMTTEILRNYLFKSSPELENIGVVIFDEVHYIKDRDRGAVWEESIIMMPPQIQMVLLSATLPDAEAFGQWVATCKNHPVSYITTSRRVVPLTHYLMTGPAKSQMIQIMDNNKVFQVTAYSQASSDYSFKPSALNAYIRAMDLPAMFFCFSRKKCETHAKSIQTTLVNATEATAIGNLYKNLVRKFDKSVEFSLQAVELYPLLLKGVGFHHAGLLNPLKEIVQVLFTQGLIKVLFVTETFAAGVNMPAKTVVFTGLTKFETQGNTFRLLYTEEYLQMAGRAGRRGIDTTGTVILLPFRTDDLPDIPVMRGMLTGEVRPIVSRLRLDIGFILKSLYGEKDIHVLLAKSLYASQLKKEIESRTCYLEKLQAQAQAQASEVEEIPQETMNLIQSHGHYIGKMLSGKSARAYHKTLAAFPGGLAALEPLYQRYTAGIEQRKKITDAQIEVACLTTQMNEELFYQFNFLYNYGFLKTQYADFNTYSKADLTALGVACTEINECDPHLLSKCIYTGLFDELTEDQLIAGLAVFLGAEKDREIKYSSLKRVLDPIYQMEITINEQRRQAGIADLEPPLSDYWVDPVMAWITEGKMGAVYNENDEAEALGEGEFVKAILKVNNIAEEVLNVANLLQLDVLAKKLENAKTRLVWGMVTPHSLYL